MVWERVGIRAQPLEEDRPGLHIRPTPTGPGHIAELKPQCPLKRAIILPLRIILGLNEINGVCEALAQCLAHCQCSINVASQKVFSSSPTCVQVGSAA